MRIDPSLEFIQLINTLDCFGFTRILNASRHILSHFSWKLGECRMVKKICKTRSNLANEGACFHFFFSRWKYRNWCAVGIHKTDYEEKQIDETGCDIFTALLLCSYVHCHTGGQSKCIGLKPQMKCKFNENFQVICNPQPPYPPWYF